MNTSMYCIQKRIQKTTRVHYQRILTFIEVRVVVPLHVYQGLSHAVVESENGGIVENNVNHLLKFVGTLWEE